MGMHITEFYGMEMGFLLFRYFVIGPTVDETTIWDYLYGVHKHIDYTVGGLESFHPKTSSPRVSSPHIQSVHPIVESVHPTYCQSVHPTHGVSLPQHMNIVFLHKYLFVYFSMV